MRYLSVCSGIEAATVAWHPLGWTPVAFSEIEKLPSQVLAHHYPDVPNWGDMTKLKEWPDADVDVLVGGTPCQSFSVAGLRKGLADPRGNLMLTYLAIADRYRPRWLVWENVPGVLSSHGGRDFGTFLGALGELGYGFAYRVLDAQYFGVAQRRRRVFVVGYLGDWRRAAAVLFERDSLSGNPAPRREARKDTAGSTGDGLARCITTGEAKRQDWETCNMIAHTLSAEHDASEDGAGRGTPLVPVQPYTLAIRGRGDSHDLENRQDGMANALLTPNGGRGGIGVGAIAFHNRQDPDISGDITHPIGAKDNGMAVMYDTLTQQGNRHHASTQKAHAGTLLRALSEEVGTQAFAQWGLGILDSLLPQEVLRSALHGVGIRYPSLSRRWVVYHALSRPQDHSEGIVQAMREAGCDRCASQGWRPPEQLARELGAYLSELSHPGAQAQRFMRDLWDASERDGVLQQALLAVQEVGRPDDHQAQPAFTAMQVRRLTCEEAEFLQGFPRSYTDIRPNGKATPDGPRYKALGNSMAVPCMAWIGNRIALVDALRAP